MDFFQAQEKARKRTSLLLLLYVLAVAMTTAAIYAIAMVVFAKESSWERGNLWDPGLLITVGFGTFAIIGGASLVKIGQLSAGGSAVAESLGCKEVSRSSPDLLERRLLNVVEEMAIASGVPMPKVYLMEESGINAFAAGYSIHDAAVAVTRGALEKLSRDELQGVMAHEFSHILNGDMRLNIRLLGPLFGLLVITFIGRILMRTGRVRSSSREGGNATAGIALFGVALLVIGYIGVFFGRLIQSAISRQREYLADSAAVQFTRNPAGISGALKRIGFRGTGSKIEHEHAVDTAHFFFAKALGGGFATHPPLEQRIRAIEPDWDGKFLPPLPANPARGDVLSGRPEKPVGEGHPSANHRMQAAMAAGMVGQISQEAVHEAKSHHSRLRESLGSLLESPSGCRAVILTLILSNQTETRDRQIVEIRNHFGDETVSGVASCHKAMETWTAPLRFDALVVAVAGIKQLPAPSLTALPMQIKALIPTLTDLEQALVIVFLKHEIEGSNQPWKGNSLSGKAADFAEPIAKVLALTASLEGGEAARNQWELAVRSQSLFSGVVRYPQVNPTLEDLEPSLDSLLQMSFPLRRALIEAAASIVLADHEVTDDEWQLLRLIALAIDCPMPLFHGKTSQ
jgi:Zn-dependent protease with chaperone function